MDALRPGGVLLIRDGDRDLEKRHEAYKNDRIFFNPFFSFNKTGGHPLHFLSGKTISDLARRHQMDCRTLDSSNPRLRTLFL